jgi:hypothetical protein
MLLFLATIFSSGVLEIANTLTDATANLWQAICPEDQNDDRQND